MQSQRLTKIGSLWGGCAWLKPNTKPSKCQLWAPLLSTSTIPGTTLVNGLWYVGTHLVIPRVGGICKNLFHLAHDTLGHFGADRIYCFEWLLLLAEHEVRFGKGIYSLVQKMPEGQVKHNKDSKTFAPTTSPRCSWSVHCNGFYWPINRGFQFQLYFVHHWPPRCWHLNPFHSYWYWCKGFDHSFLQQLVLWE